jgi:signal transduction histidine kinase
LQTAQLALQSLKVPGATVEGLPGQLLTRALGNIGALIERTLSDVRLTSGVERRELIHVTPFFEEVTMAARLHAESRGQVFVLDCQTAGAVEADPQQLMSAVMNLVHNALKFTKRGGTVGVAVRVSATRLSIAVEDQCGGIPDSAHGLFSSFTDRRSGDRSGLGLGLSIAKKIIRAHDGDIDVRNVPGTGCVFTIDMPLVAALPRSPRRRRPNWPARACACTSPGPPDRSRD